MINVAEINHKDKQMKEINELREKEEIEARLEKLK